VIGIDKVWGLFPLHCIDLNTEIGGHGRMTLIERELFFNLTGATLHQFYPVFCWRLRVDKGNIGQGSCHSCPLGAFGSRCNLLP